MHIIVPAYNVKPEQATRFEAQIAAVMLRHRAEELAMTKTGRGPRLTATPPSNSKAAPRQSQQAHRKPSEGPTEARQALRPSPHREGVYPPLAGLPAGPTAARPVAEQDPAAEALIIHAQHVQYKPGGTSPTDELIVKVLIVAAKAAGAANAAAGRPGTARGLSTIQVAEKLDISRQAANAALKRLQAKKLVTIVPVHDLDPETRRGYGVALKALWTVVRA
jgi:hypothetical protein